MLFPLKLQMLCIPILISSLLVVMTGCKAVGSSSKARFMNYMQYIDIESEGDDNEIDAFRELIHISFLPSDEFGSTKEDLHEDKFFASAQKFMSSCRLRIYAMRDLKQPIEHMIRFKADIQALHISQPKDDRSTVLSRPINSFSLPKDFSSRNALPNHENYTYVLKMRGSLTSFFFQAKSCSQEL